MLIIDTNFEFYKERIQPAKALQSVNLPQELYLLVDSKNPL